MNFKICTSSIARSILLCASLSGVFGPSFTKPAEAAPPSLPSDIQNPLADPACEPNTGWVWTSGPSQPEAARQAEAALRQNGIDSTVSASGFGEQDACGNFQLFSIDFSLTLQQKPGIQGAAPEALVPDIVSILENATPYQVGKVQIMGEEGGVLLYAGSGTVPDRQRPQATISTVPTIATKKVYVIVYDPLLSNGQRLSVSTGWNSHSDITQQVIDYFADVSGNQIRYQIVRTDLITDTWPALTDGFKYTESLYMDVLAKLATPHSPQYLDYDKVIDEFQICQKANNGEFDEVWLFGGPWFGYYESRLVGPGAYAYNSPAISLTHGCNQLVPIMGLNYEREIQEAIHSFGHRAEAAMTKVYGSWQQNRTTHNWERFGLAKGLSPSYSYSGCGTIHYPPNATTGYDYRNPDPALTNCEDFMHYPDLRPAESVLQTVTCDQWNCDHLGYLTYWYQHMPAASACGTDAVENNWWPYFADPSFALFPSRYCPPQAPSPLLPGNTLRVSVNSAGGQAQGEATSPAVSADGRYVAFPSSAANLVFGDTNKTDDIFLRDLKTGMLTRVSVSSSGMQASGYSGDPAISADGRFIAFQSSASDLVPGDTNTVFDVFVHDAQTGETTRISVSSSGEQANAGSYAPSLSADGRYVAFYSEATNLVTGDANRKSDIFVHDLQTGATRLVSVSSSGVQANNYSNGAAISGDGRFVAFQSAASNLVEGDTNGRTDIFVHDLQASLTWRASTNSGGLQANGDSYNASLSQDGSYLAFESFASNLVSDDTNARADIFVHDTQTRSTTRVSVSASGGQANNVSANASISGDGRYVAFSSRASSLVAKDTNAMEDIFVYDRLIRWIGRVSVDSAGAQANTSSHFPVISGNGQYTVFWSYASNLISGDTNGQADVFIHRPSLQAPSTPTPTATLTKTPPPTQSSTTPVLTWQPLTPTRTITATNTVTNPPPTSALTFTPTSTPTPTTPATRTSTATNAPLGTIFADVPEGYWAQRSIESLYRNGITGGCGAGKYCPDAFVTRAQMAVFLERAIHGPSYLPPAVGGSIGFTDVDPLSWAASWIKQLAAEGITGGCGAGKYCPEGVVTRAQMAVFLLRAKHGVNYAPPSVGATSGFNDVPQGYWAASWIKQLAAERMTGGCGAGNFCPEAPVTRAQMAVFLVRAFNLP